MLDLQKIYKTHYEVAKGQCDNPDVLLRDLPTSASRYWLLMVNQIFVHVDRAERLVFLADLIGADISTTKSLKLAEAIAIFRTFYIYDQDQQKWIPNEELRTCLPTHEAEVETPA